MPWRLTVMIDKLRKRFIVAAMLAVFIVMSLILIALNGTNYLQTRQRADEVLNVLAEFGGVFPNFSTGKKDYSFATGIPGMVITVETPYETRYFRMVTNNKNEITDVDLSNIQSVDYDTAKSYGEKALLLKKNNGYINDFRYLVSPLEEGGKLLLFIDNRREMSAFRSLAERSLLIGLISLLAIFLLVLFFSKKLMRPFEENIKRQQQFVTDAGHEIKTPLSIISANNDVQELTDGPNEWTQSTKRQVQRLSELIESLLNFARASENEISKEVVDFTTMLTDSATSFELLSSNKHVNFEKEITDDVSVYGDRQSLEKLISILLDNANKYVSENGSIHLLLTKNKRYMFLSVRNTVHTMPENMDRLFDRFYREDASRSHKTGGYGIGLSLAQAIVEQHDGKISAKAYDKETISFDVSLPLLS